MDFANVTLVSDDDEKVGRLGRSKVWIKEGWNEGMVV